MKIGFRLLVPVALVVLMVSCASKVLRKDEKDAGNTTWNHYAAQQPTLEEHLADKVPTMGSGVDYARALEVVLKPTDDLPAIFRELTAAARVQRIVFSPGVYVVRDTLHLPRTRSLLVIDGQGAVIKASGDFPVFYSLPVNQSEAMVYNKTRYLIKDFGNIEGGGKGVFLGSSFNTVIQNIEFIGQKEAAVDLVFCLMCTVEQVLVTNPFHDGIVLRSGVDEETRANAWPGTSFNNSQCNHTVLRSCRVYNRKDTKGTSFKVLQTTGVRLIDCISEGWVNARAVFFDAKGCTTAKFFAIQNFHLEHAPYEGGLVFQSFGSTVEVDGLFTQIASADSPTIWLMNNGNYVFKNIPWWPQGAWVNSSHSPAVVIQHCTNRFYDFQKVWRNGERPGQPIFRNYFRTSADLVR